MELGSAPSQAVPPPSAPDERSVPIFEVALGNGMWWSIPQEMSQQLFGKYSIDQDAGYTWDWGDSRSGSWKPEDADTSINRYVIDFVAWEQRNIDNDRRRAVRLVWVRPRDVTPSWTGHIPTS
jgi:hypothetical protein